MPELFGRAYSRAELTARVGRLEQLAGIRVVALDDGYARGLRAFELTTGGGLSFLSLAGRALDVAHVSYRGIPLCWSSQNAFADASFCDPSGDAFLRTFFGGLFTTCGLTNFGPGGSDRWGTFGLHGRIDATPAEAVAYETHWEGERCFFDIRATMRETRVFGENLRLERHLRAELGGRQIGLRDRVTNDGGVSFPHMLLYHCNGGFPLLDEHARLYVSGSEVRPRDADAKRELDAWDRGGPPQAGFQEEVFIHRPVACEGDEATIALVNDRLAGGLGLAIHFRPAQLPALFNWRMLGHGTYVMGMEPANCPTIQGRVEAEKRGTLPMLEPGETRDYDLRFEVLDGAEAIATTLASIGRIAASRTVGDATDERC